MSFEISFGCKKLYFTFTPKESTLPGPSGRSPDEFVGSNPTEDMNVCLL